VPCVGGGDPIASGCCWHAHHCMIAMLHAVVVLLAIAHATLVSGVVNTRSTLLVSTFVEKSNTSVRVLLRSGESAEVLSTATCNYFQKLGDTCSDKERADIVKNLEQHVARFETQSFGEQVMQQVRFGWDLALSHGSPDEARLHFSHALAIAPASTFVLQEFAAFSIVATSSSHNTIVFATDGMGAWGFQSPPKPDDVSAFVELWESYAAVRFRPPVRPLGEEEHALLEAGMPPSAFVPCAETDLRNGQLLLLGATFVHRIRHDLELASLLKDEGLLPGPVADAAIAVYSQVLEASGAQGTEHTLLKPAQEAWRSLHPYLNRRLYVHPSPALPRPVVAVGGNALAHELPSGGHATSQAGGYLSTGGLLVIDDLLTPEALSALRDFAELSTIWFQERTSYLKASMGTGFATPLLVQIVKELRSSLPKVLCDIPLSGMWAYKYDDDMQTGLGIHADDGAVSVNLWITPDENNLDGESGGLIVFDAAMSKGSSREEGAVDELLKQTGRSNVTIPYRQNRAVVFDSARLHSSQEFTFRRGPIRSRRISISFVFGSQGSYCPLRHDLELVAKAEPPGSSKTT